MREAEQLCLLVVAGGMHRVGIPLASVRETMRPLALEPLRGTPSFVLGLAIIRGASVPVVDLGALFGHATASTNVRRFVTLELEGRSVALAVSAVEGVRALDSRDFSAMPPLFARAAGEAIEALTLHDAGLLFVLSATRLVPHLPNRSEEAHP
jgi:purine-binding chemotaxis protein CheW